MGNCFVSKPKKEFPRKNEKEDTGEASEALKQFNHKQRIKEDTITEQIHNGTLLKQEDKKNSGIEQDSQDQDQVKQRGEKKNKKFLQAVIFEDSTENVVKVQREKKPMDYQVILNALTQHYFFANISDAHKEDIVYQMFCCTVGGGEYIFKQGDQASAYFIISSGSCEIIINDEVKKVIAAGQGFGELALLYGAPRSASIRTLEDTVLWGIDRITFRKAVEELVQKEYSENRKFIDSIAFFNWMNNDQKDSIAGAIITQQFKKDQPIVNEGDMASSYFIIKQGTVRILKGGKEIRKMNEGDSFGEQALYQNSQRGASVIAESDVVRCLAIGREMITRILGDKIQVIMYNNLLKWAFEKNTLLCKLTKIQIEKIVAKVNTITYKENDIIFTGNSKCDKLVIVLEGILKNSSKDIANKGNMIGDQFLVQKNREKLIPYDIFMDKGGGKVAEISFSQFFECIGGDIESAIIRNENNHEIKYMQKQKSSAPVDHIKLEEMIAIKKLGFGQFGSVYLCRNQKDQKLYGVKCILKNQIVEQHLESHLVMERKVLECVQFPLIMRFFKSMKDDNFIYFLVEYIKGMELFDVIRDIGLLNSYDSQFFIGSLLLCMEYLHQHAIIYRDIKPENIMVDHQGYMRLIDMGTAKFLKSKGRTFTIIGTPHYMAPEIITGKGYTYTVDLWSIGVCLYEFMCGGVPFAEDAEDPYEIYEEIVKKPLTFPSFLKDRKARKLMDQLLSKTPEVRLGTSYAALKANPWFETLDWDKLMDRELKPPYIPPKDKIISDKEIQKLEALNKSLITEIKNDTGDRAMYNPEKAKDQQWDASF